MSDDARVLIARIGAPHGVRGDVRLIPFGDEPEAVAEYGPLESRDGRTFEITGLRFVGDKLVAHLSGIDDRTAAEGLTNLDLFVARANLPEPDDEDTFYHADLIGLTAVTPDGTLIGSVIALPNFGAGDLIEIAPPRGVTLLVPFTKEVVPLIDIAAGRLVVDPPPGLIGGESAPPPKPQFAKAGKRKAGHPRGDGSSDPETPR